MTLLSAGLLTMITAHLMREIRLMNEDQDPCLSASLLTATTFSDGKLMIRLR